MCYNTRETRKVKDREIYYRVGLYPKQEHVREEFDIPIYHNNGFRHANKLIIPQEAPQYLITAKWGIVPSMINNKAVTSEQVNDYYKDKLDFKPGNNQGLNAKSEKAYNYYANYFEDAILNRRCIIPVDGFYEPHRLPNNVSVPFNFQNKDNEQLSLAGIYSVLKGGFCTFTVFTKKASPLFEEVHNSKKRQPLILGREEVDVWLNKDTSENEIRSLLQYKYDNSLIQAYPISRDLNRPSIETNSEEILKKVDYFTDASDIENYDLNKYKFKHLFQVS